MSIGTLIDEIKLASLSNSRFEYGKKKHFHLQLSAVLVYQFSDSRNQLDDNVKKQRYIKRTLSIESFESVNSFGEK